MVERVERWIANDGQEFETEKAAIIHELCKEEIRKLVLELEYNTSLYSAGAKEVAEYIISQYKLEKRNV